eukprot:TRINITY_DN851_c0_g1_i2.p1 TRINITY_DN851_c0_g1~~TRINITY_DN851_c0_g1_i2.p1  ORF type:complete len:105 (+),score=2.08 TRINITY_DN851_c0_g1_i2:33-317(+)
MGVKLNFYADTFGLAFFDGTKTQPPSETASSECYRWNLSTTAITGIHLFHLETRRCIARRYDSPFALYCRLSRNIFCGDLMSKQEGVDGFAQTT